MCVNDGGRRESGGGGGGGTIGAGKVCSISYLFHWGRDHTSQICTHDPEKNRQNP